MMKSNKAGLNPSEVTVVSGLSDIVPDAIVSRTLVKNKAGTVTFFAFAAGQELSKHSAPFDALVHITDGQAVIVIDDTEYSVGAGELILMPANIPHAVRADNDFKMMLTLLKEAE
jgi:quercetin dioxygenase-like cupin family protein